MLKKPLLSAFVVKSLEFLLQKVCKILDLRSCETKFLHNHAAVLRLWHFSVSV